MENANNEHQIHETALSEQPCLIFDEDSDVAQLEILQTMLLNLDEDNFREIFDWIKNSIFVKSEEGIHDLIYTFYLISAARVNDDKSSIFSRMITSLFHSLESSKYLELITVHATELLTIGEHMYIDDFIKELISSSIIEKSNYKKIKSRKYPHYENCSYGKKRFNQETVMLSDQRLIYPRFKIDEPLIIKIISNDDLVALEDIMTGTIGFDIDERIKMPFNTKYYVFSLIDFAAFKGSIKCFKYLLVNGANLGENTVRYSFYSGNIEIIRILEHNLDFQYEVIISSAYFHNDIFDWLIDGLGRDISTLKSSENVHALRRLLEQNVLLDCCVFNTWSIILTKFFINYFNDEKFNNIAFFNACKNGNLGLVRFLFEHYQCSINCRQGDYNSFQIAFLENRVGVLKYLSKQPNIHFSFYEEQYLHSYGKNKIGLDFYYVYALSEKLMDLLDLIMNIPEIELGEGGLIDLIRLEDQNLFLTIYKNERVWKSIDLNQAINICLESYRFNSFRHIISITKQLTCLQYIFDQKKADLQRAINIIFEIIDKNPSEFFVNDTEKWKNLREFELWIFQNCCQKNFQYLVEYKLIKKRKISVNDKNFLIALKMCIDFEDETYGMIKWLISTYKKYFEQYIDEIFDYSKEKGKMKLVYLKSKYFYSKMSDDIIHSMLFYAVKTWNQKIINKYKDLIPKYCYIVKDGETLITAAIEKRHQNILINLVDFDKLDITLPACRSLAYKSYYHHITRNIFRKLILLPETDVNRYEKCLNNLLTLIQYVSSCGSVKTFELILKRQDVDVNEPLLVKNCCEKGYLPINSMIHSLMFRKDDESFDKLKILLNYHSTDVNIKNYENATALIIAIKKNNFKAV